MVILRAILCLLLVVPPVVTTAASAAHAQSKQDIETAKERFREGKKHYDDEEYAAAAAAFEEAYELSGRVELLYNIGQSHRLAGNLREAEKFLQSYLAESPDAPNADAVVETIVELQQKIAGQLATVQVETDAPGRSVFVDDEQEPRCETPCSVTVPPGQRRIILRAEGFQELVEEVSLEPGKTFQLKTQMKRSVVPGRLLITTDRPGGRLTVGQQVKTALPLRQPIVLEPGDYPIEVESARRAKWQGKVTIEPDETTEVLVPMQSLVEARKRGSLRKSIAYGLWGVSVATGVGGMFLGMRTNSLKNTAIDQNESRQFVDPQVVAQGRTHQQIANTMFAVAAGSVVTGIALFVWDEFTVDKDPTGPSPRPSDELVER